MERKLEGEFPVMGQVVAGYASRNDMHKARKTRVLRSYGAVRKVYAM